MKQSQPVALASTMLMPPAVLMWATVYAGVFYLCGTMIAALYSVD